MQQVALERGVPSSRHKVIDNLPLGASVLWCAGHPRPPPPPRGSTHVLASSSVALRGIDWHPTADGNVDVLNDTADYYRYFDATAHAEFLVECVEQAVEHDLPEEVRFLTAFDRFSSSVKDVIEMPDRKLALLRAFLAQGKGRLSLP